jgi:hypothetical protein
MTRTASIITALALLAGCRDHRMVATIEGADSMRSAVLSIAPVGSRIDSAPARLALEGFRCSPGHGRIAGRPASDYLLCTASVSVGSPVARRWVVVLFSDSARVTDVAANSGLVGP